LGLSISIETHHSSLGLLFQVVVVWPYIVLYPPFLVLSKDKKETFGKIYAFCSEVCILDFLQGPNLKRNSGIYPSLILLSVLKDLSMTHQFSCLVLEKDRSWRILSDRSKEVLCVCQSFYWNLISDYCIGLIICLAHLSRKKTFLSILSDSQPDVITLGHPDT